MDNDQCQICKQYFPWGEMYEYRGFISCGEHFDELCGKVDWKRQQVMEVVDNSVRSQADGEWANGGYKTMKVDTGGRPIASKVTEPVVLQEYERGIL